MSGAKTNPGRCVAGNSGYQHPRSGLLYRRGKPYQLLLMAGDGEISMTVSQPIIDEIADVLARKFQRSEDFIAEAKTIVTRPAAS